MRCTFPLVGFGRTFSRATGATGKNAPAHLAHRTKSNGMGNVSAMGAVQNAHVRWPSAILSIRYAITVEWSPFSCYLK